MALLPRVLQKIFGSTGATSEFGEIGSQAAGSATTTKDLATIQSLSQFLEGLYSITNSAGEPPRIQDLNSLYLLITSQLKYLFQEGIPEYISTEEYYVGSVCQVAGVLYTSKTGTSGSPNIGNAVSDTNNWKKTLAISELSGLGINWLTALAASANSGAANGIDAKTLATVTPGAEGLLLLALASLSSLSPNMDGTAAAGSSNIPSRQDHVHPTDTSRLAISSLGSNWAAALSAGINGHSQATTASISINGGYQNFIQDIFYGAGSCQVYLPAIASIPFGGSITVNNVSNNRVDIWAQVGEQIGYYNGASGNRTFSLYATGDTVTLIHAASGMFLVAYTNGPELVSTQSSNSSATTSGAWAFVGSGLSLGTLPPGVYDVTAVVTISCYTGSNQLTSNYRMALFYASTLFGPIIVHNGPSAEVGTLTTPVSVSARIILSASAIVQLGYYWNGYGSANIPYDTLTIGKITARRIG